MPMHQEDNDLYIIPPNFIESGTLSGGTVKIRNAIETAGIALAVGIPVFNLPVTLTTKIIVACVTVLPLSLFALIGIDGESLTSFAINFFIYLKKRRIVGIPDPEAPDTGNTKPASKKCRPLKERAPKAKKEKFAEEFDQVREKKEKPGREKKAKHASATGKKTAKKATARPADYAYLNPAAAYLPIEKIANGIVYTKDHRYVKIIEVVPINFLLRSAREQRNIIYFFVSYLKISPVKLQFKVLTRWADINRYLEAIREEMKTETDERCIALQKDYEKLIKQIGSKEAITRRFFIIFQYEPFTGSNRHNEELEAINALKTAVQTARTYLQQCGNEIIQPDNEDELATEVLYSILNRKSSLEKPLSVQVNEIIGQYVNAGRHEDLDHIPATEFMAPERIDYTHINYVVMDGVFHTYLLIPGRGYRPQVCAGWLSLLVNAGDGIDVDLFLDRQPKDRIQQKLGQ